MHRSLNAVREYLHRNAAKQQVVPRTIAEKLALGKYDGRANDVHGDQLLSDIIRTMGEYGQGKERIQMRVDQQTMMAHCINALLPLIYGDKLESNRKRLLRRLGLKRITQEVVILASRRVGKTWFVAMLLAACLICFPKIEIACFSLALRTSKKMMRLVVDMLNRHEKGKTMIERMNMEQLRLKGNTDYNYKLLHSFPDQPDVGGVVWLLFVVT